MRKTKTYRFIKITAALVAIITLIVPAGIVAAADTPSDKEEVVYGLLDYDGGVKSIYVVNILQGGEITDYGSYSEIHNMTSTEALNRNGDLITVDTTADKLYYQGTLETKDLPWVTSVKYYLNGAEFTGLELAGKSGELKIGITVTQNAEINSTFYENYALQISLTLDTKLCENIKAEGATIAEAGRNKQLNFTVLPGEGADLEVTATVHDFEMEPVSISGIRLNLGLSFDETEFTNQIAQLTEAVKGLDDGAEELLSGVTELSEGMKGYVEGLKEFKNGVSALDAGVADLKKGAVSLSNGLTELSKQNEALVGGATAIRQSAFDAVNAQLSAMGLGLPALTPQNYEKVLSGIPNLAVVKAQLDGAVQFTEGLISYTNAVTQLEGGASELADGASELKASTAVLASSAKELYDAGVTLNNAVSKLRDGLAAFKSGTGEMVEGTSGYDTEIENQINGILDRISGSDSQVVSFVSPKNTKISAVQFVMKTEAIRLPEVETVVEKPKKLSFWQKLLRLFGLY